MTDRALKITAIEALQAADGGVRLIFSVGKELAEQAIKTAQNANDALTRNKAMELVVRTATKRRSLDANAYFHLLCGKIAAVVGISLEAVKKDLVINYGTPTYAIIIPREVDVEDLYPYSRFIGEDDMGSQYLLYKQTHTLNSAEMARLIDGAVQEASQLGIETLTPKELARLQEKWGKKNGNRETGDTAENTGKE